MIHSILALVAIFWLAWMWVWWDDIGERWSNRLRGIKDRRTLMQVACDREVQLWRGDR